MDNQNNNLSEENKDSNKSNISIIIAIVILVLITVWYLYYNGNYEDRAVREPRTAQEAVEMGFLDAPEKSGFNRKQHEDIIRSLTAPQSANSSSGYSTSEKSKIIDSLTPTN